MNKHKDIIVIGGGIIGVSAAYYLAMQGRSVTLIEKDEISAGSSFGNAGLIANGFVIPLPAPGMPSQGLKLLLDSTSSFYIKPRLDLDLLRWLWKFYGACNENKCSNLLPFYCHWVRAALTCLMNCSLKKISILATSTKGA